MSIQSISSNSGNQYVSALTTDFTNLQNDIQSLERAQSSAKQDQVTLSQDALQKAMTQFQTDLASLTQGTQAAQGHHHHHHHHKVSAASADGSSSSTGQSSAGQTQNAASADGSNSSSGQLAQLLDMLQKMTASTSSTSGVSVTA